MSVLGTIDIQEFLRDYWQQKPLLIRGATMDYGNILTPDELAGLACEEEIESRLVIQETDELWSLEHGPLKESRFSELPEKNWTLLVQALDHWLPEVREILDEFKFLPSWRLDDVMASYAATGGSVGPHFDYYDVFLLQTRGHR
ncbi:MAG: cupin domain-containing protein, partial [Pseudomonadales bacterium]